jgi:hypothetical protein
LQLPSKLEETNVGNRAREVPIREHAGCKYLRKGLGAATFEPSLSVASAVMPRSTPTTVSSMRRVWGPFAPVNGTVYNGTGSLQVDGNQDVAGGSYADSVVFTMSFV